MDFLKGLWCKRATKKGIGRGAEGESVRGNHSSTAGSSACTAVVKLPHTMKRFRCVDRKKSYRHEVNSAGRSRPVVLKAAVYYVSSNQEAARTPLSMMVEHKQMSVGRGH